MLSSRLLTACILTVSFLGCQGGALRDTTPNELSQPTEALVTAGPSVSQTPAAAQLSLAVDLSNAVVLADKPGELLVRVRLKGLPIADEKRPPLSLALVIDTSGSMEGEAIERAREACQTLVDSLKDGDRVAIVSFGTSPKTIVAAQTLTADVRAQAKKAIADIRAEGTTNLAGGLSLGMSELQRIMQPAGGNRLVLVGDGVPNDATQLPAIAANARNLNVPITALGLGAEFDETVMTQIAQTSGGTFHFIDEPSRVAKVFEAEIERMSRVVARATTVDVTPGPGVSILEVFGAPASALQRGSRLSFGELSEGQSRDVVLRLAVAPTKDGGSIELLDTVLNYTHGIRNVPMTETLFRRASATKDAAARDASRDLELELQGARLVIAQNLVTAIAMARGGDPNGARALLDETARFALSESKRLKDADLEKKAAEARALKKTVASLAPQPVMAVPVMHDGGVPRPMTAPVAAPVALSPAQALDLKRSHAGAMRELQTSVD